MLPLILTVLAVIPTAFGTADHVRHEERQVDARQALDMVMQQYTQATQATFNEQCNAGNIIVRKEWGNMSPEERQDFIRANRCMYQMDALTPRYLADGVRTRRDDFSYLHIRDNTLIHFSPYTLAFHRVFVKRYEDILRNDCGYQGGMPYMGFEKYGYQDFEQTPMFDGSPTSLGGNGVQQEDGCFCVDGPFSDFVTNLGPVNADGGCRPNPQSDGLGYNPRCLERNFNRDPVGNLTYENVLETITGFFDAADLGLRIEQWPTGLHPTGHIAVGGAQADIPGSTCDVWFFIMHCGIDRVWAHWQSIDYAGRTYAYPPAEQYNPERWSRGWPDATPMTPETYIDLSPSLQGAYAGDVASTTHGELCYIYE